MDKGSSGRGKKVVSGGHSTRVEGLNNFLAMLEKWPEVSSIRLGSIRSRNRVGRKSKRLKQTPPTETELPSGHVVVEASFVPRQGHKRARGGGGFTFKATRPAMIGPKVVGIKCDASNGTVTQEVVLGSADLDALKQRLNREGYGANW